MKPLIGVTCGTFHDRAWCPPIHGHRHTYVDAVVRAGGAPLLVPLVEDLDVLRAVYEGLDGVLLAGGCDVDPVHYGEEPLPQLGVVDNVRDLVELQLARWASEDGKPILGICRGMQVMNVALGGTLYQDIPTQCETEVPHDTFSLENWAHLAHDVELVPDSTIANVLGVTRFSINSFHHQSLKQIAPQLKPVGWAPDGVVEFVEGLNGHFMVGIQCHPEVLQAEIDTRWQGLFRAFVERCVRVPAQA
jgi:putative glutamine amidotransferase